MNKTILVSVKNAAKNKWIVSGYYGGFRNFPLDCSFEQLNGKLKSFGWVAA